MAKKDAFKLSCRHKQICTERCRQLVHYHDPDDLFERRLIRNVRRLLASSEELRLYFHPHSETVINIRSPACAEETLTAGHEIGRAQRQATHVNTHTVCMGFVVRRLRSLKTKLPQKISGQKSTMMQG